MVFSADKEKEGALIESLKQGERSAFDQLVDMYRNRGFAVAYNFVGNVEDAKDVLQEAFIKVYLNIKSFKEKSEFSTWFYRIVVNSSLDFLRRQKRASRLFVSPLPEQEASEREIPDLRYEPAKIIASQELSSSLDKYIMALPQKQRTCFILKHQSGMTNHQIAQVLGCGISTVKVHLFRAVKNLQEKLSGYLVR